MRTRLFRWLSVVTVCVPVPCLMAQSTDFHRTLEVQDHPDLYVSTGSGNIRVAISAGHQITIVGHVHASRPQRADTEERIRQIVASPPVAQSGNDVRLGEVPDRSLYNGISIDYEIKAPRQVAMNLRTGSGDIEVSELGRFLAAESGSGNLKIQGLHGPADLHTGSGDISLEQDGDGQVRARTGSGNLQLAGLHGPLEAHTGSGDVQAAGAIQAPGEVTSGSGSLHLRLAPDSRLDLRAQTGSGDIKAEIPGLQVSSQGKHELRAQLHGGGPTLTLRTGSGDIELRQE